MLYIDGYIYIYDKKQIKNIFQANTVFMKYNVMIHTTVINITKPRIVYKK